MAGAPKGNKNAAKENRLVGDMLKRVAAQNPKKLRSACEALLDKAAAGDVQAFREFTDRTDGKAVQPIEADVTASVTVEVIKFADSK